MRWAQHRVYLDETALPRDTAMIHRVYAEWGYPDAHATAQVEREGNEATVLFRVTEGTPLRVRSVRVEGLEGTGVAVPPLPLEPGGLYAPALLDASQRLILGRLGSTGRPFGQVEVSGQVTGGAADVVLHVTPGPFAVFDSTTIEARPPLTTSLVQRRLAWRPGQRFDPSAVARTRERLLRIPVIDTALVVPQRGAAGDSSVDVAIEVTPGRISAIQGGGSISSGSCLSGQIHWSDRYLAGKPRVVTIGAGASNLLASSLGGFPCTGAASGPFSGTDYFARGDWREPVGADTWLLFAAGYARYTAPSAYIIRGYDGRIGLDRDLRPGTEVVASFAPSREESTAGGPFFCALYGACTAAQLAPLEAFTTLAPIGLDLTWAPPGHVARLQGPQVGPLAALSAMGPAWLYGARISVQGAPAARHYLRGELTTSATRLLGRRLELAGRIRLGGLAAFGDTLPPQVRLFGGGPNGVRGAQQNLLGPKILVADSAVAAGLPCAAGGAGSCAGVHVTPDQVLVHAAGGDRLLESGIEARVWVSQQVQLAAFLDYGVVWSGALAGSPESLSASESMLSPGVGIRFVTPVGPLRLDFAYDPTHTVNYPLLAERADGTFVNLGEVVYDPYAGVGGSLFNRVRHRIQLQFSLGQPF
jgi:outer membrane protein assembly factor BamA